MSSHCGICFGQGHSEKNCDSKPISRAPDSDNPMHKIGYGRGDDHVQIMPARIVNVGGTMEPTVPMEAVQLLTVKDIVHRLIERNLQAWKALPEKVRDLMMEQPQKFQLIGNSQTKDGGFDYNILYNGTVWRYNSSQMLWVLAEII